MITPVMTNTGGSMNPGYIGLVGQFSPTVSGETRKECPMPIPCTIGGLYIKLTGGVSAGKYIKVTLRKNESDTVLTLTINGVASSGDVFSTFSAATNVDFAQGDTADWKIETDNASSSYGLFALINAESAILTCHPVAGNLSSLGGVDTYLNIHGAQGTSTDPPTFNVVNTCVMPCDGTFSNLWVHFDDETALYGNIITLYKNGSATSITCTLGVGDTVTSDNTHTVSVVAGDTVRFKCTGVGGVLNFRYVNTSIAFTPAVSNEVPFLAYNPLPTDLDTNIDYGLPAGNMDFFKFSTSNGYIVPALTVVNAIARIDIAPGVGHWEDFFVAKNNVNTAIGGRINDPDLEMTDTGSVDYACGDLFQWTRVADHTNATNPDNNYVSVTIVVRDESPCPNPFRKNRIIRPPNSGGNTLKLCN